MKCKVATIITQLEFGGAQLHALKLCEGFARAGSENLLISGVRDYLDEKADQLPHTKHVNVYEMVREISPVKDLKALWKIYKLLKKEKPLAVYTHSSKAGILGRWAAFFAGVPVRVHTIHGYGITPLQPFLLRKLLLFVERLTARVTTRFVAVSEANIRQGLKWGLFDRKKVVLIRSGINIARFAKASVDRKRKLSQIGIPERVPIVGTVACFKPQKAPLDFVKAAGYISREIPQTHFIMVGDGELRKKAELLAEEMGIGEKLHFLGWREDVETIMKLFDVFLLTSLWEGLPRVLPEVCAMGIPCVVTWVDGNKEVIRHGINGFIVPPSRPDMAAFYAVKLLRDPSLRSRLSQNAMKISEEFSEEKMIEDYLKLNSLLLSEAIPACEEVQR